MLKALHRTEHQAGLAGDAIEVLEHACSIAACEESLVATASGAQVTVFDMEKPLNDQALLQTLTFPEQISALALLQPPETSTVGFPQECVDN